MGNQPINIQIKTPEKGDIHMATIKKQAMDQYISIAHQTPTQWETEGETASTETIQEFQQRINQAKTDHPEYATQYDEWIESYGIDQIMKTEYWGGFHEGFMMNESDPEYQMIFAG